LKQLQQEQEARIEVILKEEKKLFMKIFTCEIIPKQEYLDLTADFIYGKDNYIDGETKSSKNLQKSWKIKI
jgi:hypothetical protein